MLARIIAAAAGWKWLALGAGVALLALFAWHEFDKRAAVNAAIENLVSQAEHDALKAVLEEERRLRTISRRAEQSARSLMAASLQRERTAAAELDRLRAVAEKVDGLTYPSQEDLEWHGSH